MKDAQEMLRGLEASENAICFTQYVWCNAIKVSL